MSSAQSTGSNDDGQDHESVMMEPLSQRNEKVEEHYMRQALKVAKSALLVGEVPVGCVIVLRNALGSYRKDENSMETENDVVDDGSFIISHGANQVNATRDATRHGELVAIDRMLTGGVASDQLRLTPNVMAKAAHGALPSKYYTLQHDKGPQHLADMFGDRWINVPSHPNHWKNEYGWGTGKIFDKDVLAQCDLYVTCEPCIMCAAALARVGIGRVFFGCRNDRFGGCGSLMHLHKPDTLPSPTHKGFPFMFSGILEKEAVSLLRSFYDRENFHAPDDKRKRKPEKEP